MDMSYGLTFLHISFCPVLGFRRVLVFGFRHIFDFRCVLVFISRRVLNFRKQLLSPFDGYVLWINFFAYKLLSLTGKNMPECISVKLIAILIKMVHNGAERQHAKSTGIALIYIFDVALSNIVIHYMYCHN